MRAQPYRFVAILQRGLQIADHGAGPAAVVEGLDVLGVQPQRVVEVLDRQIISTLAGIDLSAPVEGCPIVGVIVELLLQPEQMTRQLKQAA